ncbi:hypothetical protein BJ878DRAFT_515512 [Calycina marina]|uniref:Uncharacterized protein n=1 Tax=Calycina marina TaxID=1763456 RepID=A0A9P7YZD6_9HELO|nr:hypothetical protein BJ878DRAFT_515512 [Calycina marina]
MSYKMNRYWIPNVEISKKVITQDIQYYLGPGAIVRPYTREGQDGFLITTPGECLTDEQIDDICCKSREVWEQQAAARAQEKSDKQLKRPLHKPVVVSRASNSYRGSIIATTGGLVMARVVGEAQGGDIVGRKNAATG